MAKAAKLAGVKGMNDILPQDSARWEALEDTVRSVMRRHAYRNIRTPIVEPTALFVRGTGQTTDIVEKEMYAFTDRLNGEELALRPENTPGVVRAAIEHNLTYDGGKRLWYTGPMFRHERPQRGRYRQFYQLGAEALGFAGPEVDAELMLLAHELLRTLGLRNVRVELNSLGIPAERQAHRTALVAYSSSTPNCSMPMPSAACRPIRCASSTARILRCSRWSRAHRACWTTWATRRAGTWTRCSRC